MTKTAWKRWLIPAAAVVALRSSRNGRELCAPEDAVTECRYGDEANAWATREPHTGLSYSFQGGGEPIELGWGYEGEPACVIGKNRGRYLVSWAWVDPYGGSPELRVAVVERGRRISHGTVATGGWELHPIAIRPLRDGGWRIWYQAREEDPVHSVRVDRDGR